MSDIADKIIQFSAEFDRKCQERHEMGAEKYGEGSWLRTDTIESALEEIVDLANYARYSFVKLRLLQEQLAEFQTDGNSVKPIPGNEMMGKASVIQTKGIPTV